MTNSATVVKNGPAPRMSLAGVKRGRLQVPVKALGYGVDGVGKSTFASNAPKPIWLALDNRTAHLDIARLPQSETWDDALDALRLLEFEKHDYQTVVIDPVNWLEPLIVLKFSGGNPMATLAEWKGGYGKGADAAIPYWRQLIAQLERLWHRGMNVLLLAHCSVKSFNDPEGPGYDRYELALDKKAAGVLKQWSDYVLFMRHEAIGKTDPDTKKSRGISTGLRMIHTTWTAAYDAKFSGPVPPEIPLSWEAFDASVKSARELVSKANEIRIRIDSLVHQLGDAEVAAKVAEYVKSAGDNVDNLDEIVNAILVKMEAKAAAAAQKGQ